MNYMTLKYKKRKNINQLQASDWKTRNFSKIIHSFQKSLYSFEGSAILIKLFYFTIPDITDEYSISKKNDAASKKGVDRKG